MPPKRKSALSSSKSKPTATSAQPSSSDGPTLPIITTTPQSHTTSVPAKRKSSEADHANANERGHTLHPQLYTPWTLLSAQLQAEVRKGDENAYANIVPVVWSKNQNVRSGVNRVKTYLGFGLDAATKAKTKTGGSSATVMGTGTGTGIERPAALETDDGVIAVSAQGEGTGKLVGILEVAKRVVQGGAKHGEGDACREWFVYTALSSVSVPVRKREAAAKAARTTAEAAEPGSDEESDDAFETPAGEERAEKLRREPVLTVWFCRARVGGFERAFGEAAVWRVGM
jgi:hypothetical protein